MRLLRNMKYIIAVLCLLIEALPAYAQFLTDLTVTTSTSSGQTVYQYELTNGQNSTLPAIGFRIDVDPLADLTNISSSLDWLANYNAGDAFIVWESSDPTTDLLPGNSAQFFITSPLSPGASQYAILGFDEVTNDFIFNQGSTLSPSLQTVPEPSSWGAVALGLICIVMYWNRLRSNRLMTK
ncbi:PEP-CTERM sorting domain-containing protein [Nostoc sp. CHAB 5824]|nr:PEP-CTERM sorting domain-containing protein [Nostoc sp. CHAB 5824]